MWHKTSSSSVASRDGHAQQLLHQTGARQRVHHRVVTFGTLGMLAAHQVLAIFFVGHQRCASRYTPLRSPHRSTCSRGLKRKPSCLQTSAIQSAALAQPVAVGALRHQDDALAIGVQRAIKLAHFLQIRPLARSRTSADTRSAPSVPPALPAGCAAARAAATMRSRRRRIRQLRADAHQVAGHRLEHRARGLDGDVQARVAQTLGQRDDLRRDHRLAAGDHHVPRRMRAHLARRCGPASNPSLPAARKCTACRTRRSADCSRWCARRPKARPPARLRPESSRTAQRSSMPASSKPLRRSRQASHCPHGRPSGAGS